MWVGIDGDERMRLDWIRSTGSQGLNIDIRLTLSRGSCDNISHGVWDI